MHVHGYNFYIGVGLHIVFLVLSGLILTTNILLSSMDYGSMGISHNSIFNANLNSHCSVTECGFPPPSLSFSSMWSLPLPLSPFLFRSIGPTTYTPTCTPTCTFVSLCHPPFFLLSFSHPLLQNFPTSPQSPPLSPLPPFPISLPLPSPSLILPCAVRLQLVTTFLSGRPALWDQTTRSTREENLY